MSNPTTVLKSIKTKKEKGKKEKSENALARFASARTERLRPLENKAVKTYSAFVISPPLKSLGQIVMLKSEIR